MPPSRRSASRNRPGGLGRVKEATKRAKERSGNRRWLRLQDGDSVVLRLLDTGDDFRDAYVHRVPMQGDSGKYFADVPCLDQDETGEPCPGCKDDLNRRYKFWTNVIVRDWEDEETGKTADVLMIWSGGITIAKRLDKLDAKYGLAKRDIEVEREGSTKDDTSYDVEVVDDEDTPLSASDKKLAENKHDLGRYSRPPKFDDFYVPPGERNREDNEEIGERAKNRSPFAARKKGTTASGKKTNKTGLAGLRAKKEKEQTVVRRRRRSS
jgi:hypothetical protein